MKLAWLVRDSYGWDTEGNDWQIIFEEPDRYRYIEVKPVVYAELG